MKPFAIGDALVGGGEPCYIIAEAGSNHNGSLPQALALIDIAAEAGANAVKFQLFRASRLYPKNAGVSQYLHLQRSIYDIIAEMETPYEWLPSLADHCRLRSLHFLCSAFDEESVDCVDPHVGAHKIASYEVTHLPLVRHIARKRKPVIISTGTANMEEVAEAIEVIRSEGKEEIVVLQCTAAYPAPLNSMNLRAMQSMANGLGVLVGLSDHSRDPLVATLGAVALGACVIEKHFTFSNAMPGPDHGFALEPAELSTMVRKVRELEQALGIGKKEVQCVENDLRRFARRSIFALRNIEAGEPFSADNIAVLRCGNLAGQLEPKLYPALLQRHARRAISAEAAIGVDDYD